jgi:hypothetical protein
VVLLCSRVECECLPGAEPPPVREIVVVFKTHFDIGYTDLARDVVQRYRSTMIDQALEVVDKNRDLPAEQQFVWTIPGWPMRKIAEDWAGQTPERKSRITQALRDGRFVVHALPFTTHTELYEPEDCVRGLRFASEIAHESGLPLPRDSKMTDVPSHTWFVPTLLRRAGVDFLHLGCNAASSSPHVPVLFWWEGPDGSRVLTMYSASGYGTGLRPPEGWPYQTWLALYHTGDNHGPPKPEEVQAVLDEAARTLPGVQVRIGRLSDFADCILAENATLPVVRGDMPDTWIHGPMCDPAGARLARNIRPSLGITESLSTLLGIWGVPAPEAASKITAAYEQSLLYSEHTWGGALYWITRYGQDTQWVYGQPWKEERQAGRFQRLEASWAEHTGYIEAARDLVLPVLEASMRTLAQSVKVSGTRVVVFNPLPWKRTGLVSLTAPDVKLSAVRPAEGGDAVPVRVDEGTAHFVATDVPSLGYRCFVPVEPPVAAQPAESPADDTLENRWFRIQLDRQRGTVRSWQVKPSGRELVDDSAPQGFGQYLYERFDADQVAAYVKAYVKIPAEWAVNELGKPKLPSAAEVPYRAVSPSDFTLQVARDPVCTIGTLQAAPAQGLSHRVTTRLILPHDEPWVDLELTVHDKPADPWPEAGWLCLPFKVDAPQFRLGRLGSIIDPARDIIRGANCDLMAINTGVAVFDEQGKGVGLCALDNPLLSFGRPGCWRYSPEFAPERPAVYVNLFNNQWTTNFRFWNEGTWTSRVRMWAYDVFDAESNLISPALEARYPLQACAGQGAGGQLPSLQTGLEVSARGVLVTAFGSNPGGQGTLLRLWEMAGRDGTCQVRLPAGFAGRAAQEVNLRGQPLGAAVRAEQPTIPVQLQRFAPASFVFVE